MEKQQHTTKKDQKVRLKSNGQDALYSHAYAGSEGWVRDQKTDPLGYPLVFIEWDREHWADNGEPNKWAFEAHFEPVEGDAVSEQPRDMNDFMGMMAQMYEQWVGSKDAPAPAESQEDSEPQEDDTKNDRFLAALSKAFEAVKLDGEAFLLVAVHKVDDTQAGIPVHVPRVYNFYKTAEAGLVAEMQLPSILQTSMEDLTISALEGLHEDDES